MGTELEHHKIRIENALKRLDSFGSENVSIIANEIRAELKKMVACMGSELTRMKNDLRFLENDLKALCESADNEESRLHIMLENALDGLSNKGLINQ